MFGALAFAAVAFASVADTGTTTHTGTGAPNAVVTTSASGKVKRTGSGAPLAAATVSGTGHSSFASNFRTPAAIGGIPFADGTFAEGGAAAILGPHTGSGATSSAATVVGIGSKKIVDVGYGSDDLFAGVTMAGSGIPPAKGGGGPGVTATVVGTGSLRRTGNSNLLALATVVGSGTKTGSSVTHTGTGAPNAVATVIGTGRVRHPGTGAIVSAATVVGLGLITQRALFPSGGADTSFLTNYTKDRLIGHMWGSFVWTKPTQIWWGLLLTAPGALAGGTEVSGLGYGRVALFPADTNYAQSGGLTSNLKFIQWPVVAGDWGTIVGVGRYDVATGGNLEGGVLLQMPITVLAGDPSPAFPLGMLTIQIP